MGKLEQAERRERAAADEIVLLRQQMREIELKYAQKEKQHG